MKRNFEFQWSRIIYTLLAIAFGLAAIYHCVALLSPTIFPPSPAWRHSLFIIVNSIAFLLTIRRWFWLWIPFCLLTIQQLISHGTRAYEWWRHQHQIDIISIIIIIIGIGEIPKATGCTIYFKISINNTLTMYFESM